MKKIINLIILCSILFACNSAPTKEKFIFERASTQQIETIKGMMTINEGRLGIIEGEVYCVKAPNEDYGEIYLVGAKVVSPISNTGNITIWAILTNDKNEYGMCCALNEHAVSVSVCPDCGRLRRPIFIINEGVSELENYINSK